jgi:hypothetical protein
MAINETTELKKVYPSQINTKAMACRVPASDYVKFLQESINQGISMNDWLLTKVYSSNKDYVSGVIEDNNSNETLYTYEEAYEEFNPYPIRLNRPFGIYEINEESDIHNAIIEADNEIIRLRNLVDELKFKALADSTKPPSKKVASIDDIKAQLTILILQGFDDVKDRKEYRKEIYELLDELEEEIRVQKGNV